MRGFVSSAAFPQCSVPTSTRFPCAIVAATRPRRAIRPLPAEPGHCPLVGDRRGVRLSQLRRIDTDCFPVLLHVEDEVSTTPHRSADFAAEHATNVLEPDSVPLARAGDERDVQDRVRHRPRPRVEEDARVGALTREEALERRAIRETFE
jgi:hypothetical protein